MKTLLKLFIGFFFILYALLGLIFCFDSPDTLTNIELLVGYIVILCGIYYIILHSTFYLILHQPSE
mgnify:CR=1 FL=1